MTKHIEDRWDAAIPLPQARADRPVTLGHRIEAFAANALWSWSEGRDVEAASAGFGRFARWLGPKLGKAHARGRNNMAAALPHLSAEEREAALLEEWENLGRTVAEYPHLPELYDRTTIHNADRIDDLVRTGGQAVFVSGHFANWEVMAACLHRRGLRTAVVYRAANNPLVDQRIIDARAAVMSRVLLPKGKRGGRALVKAVGEGLSLCMLTDQRLSDGIEADFLGRPALTAPAAARLALRSDLPVIPLEIVRRPGVRFDLTVHEPIVFQATGDTAADTLALTTAINAKIGTFIAATPGQWLWFHRRWNPAKP